MKPTNYELNRKLDEALEKTNFDRIRAVMQLTNWTWRGKVPSKDDMVGMVKSLFAAAVREFFQRGGHSAVSSGGFEVRIDEWEAGRVNVKVTFDIA